MSNRVTAYARVRIMVDVRTGSTWGDDCPIGQIHKQAAELAHNRLARAIEGTPGLSIVGQPEILTVSTEEKT